MEAGELSMESMETLTELGDELTLGDIDGERRGRAPHTGQAEGRENIVSCMLNHNGCSVTSTSYILLCYTRPARCKVPMSWCLLSLGKVYKLHIEHHGGARCDMTSLNLMTL